MLRKRRIKQPTSTHLNPLKSSRVLERVLSYYLDALLMLPHHCPVNQPCIQLRRAMSVLKLVCRKWKKAERYVWNDRVRSEVLFIPRLEHDPDEKIDSRVRRSLLFGRYRVFLTVASERERGVYMAYDLSRGCANAVAVFVKAWVDSTDWECMTEAQVYRKLEGEPGVPRALYNKFDPTCDVYLIVLEKLGPSLQAVLDARPHRRFNSKMCMAVAMQMLSRYQEIHAHGVIHNGAKPGNVCLAASTAARYKLYAIDFGLSQVLDVSAAFNLPERTDTVGSRSFVSISNHLGVAQSQRDDLESLAYLLVYLYHGQLPWDIPSIDPDVKTHSSIPIWKHKITTPHSVLFAGMDPVYEQFMKEVKSLAFGEKPDYDAMREMFAAAWKRKDFGKVEGTLDWLRVWDDLQRPRV